MKDETGFLRIVVRRKEARKMAKEWLNHYVNVEGSWQQGQPEFFKSSNASA
ncbi:MAG TPA: hypothetical protein VGI41_03590 [Candidatus Udaeobacter sp.]